MSRGVDVDVDVDVDVGVGVGVGADDQFALCQEVLRAHQALAVSRASSRPA